MKVCSIEEALLYRLEPGVEGKNSTRLVYVSLFMVYQIQNASFSSGMLVQIYCCILARHTLEAFSFFHHPSQAP